jgi:hypothetical protein
MSNAEVERARGLYNIDPASVDRSRHTVKGLVRDDNTGQRWREFTVP